MQNHQSAFAPRRAVTLLASLILAFSLAGAALADFTYTVRPGDNLTKIARNNNTSVEALIAANKAQFPCLAANPACLQAGWDILVPSSSIAAPRGAGAYVVQPGDWMTKIARKFGVSYGALVAANAATRPCLAQPQPCALIIGWTINIPGGAQTAPAGSGSSTPAAAVREYFAALNARDFARFKASLHPDLLAESPDPDFDIQNFMELLAAAQIQYDLRGLHVDAQNADTAAVAFTAHITSPLANIDGFETSTTFTLALSGGGWRVIDEGVERVELVP